MRKKIHIPDMINGIPVSRLDLHIDKMGFAGHQEIKSVYLGKYISEIPGGSFRGCKGLKKVILPNDIRMIVDVDPSDVL